MRIIFITIIGLIMILIVANLTYGITSNNNPSTASNDNSVGTETWSNANNIGAYDGNAATASPADGEETYYLKGTNFGFSIPTSATIDGIEFTFSRSSSQTATYDNGVYLVLSNSSLGTTDKSSGTQWANTLSNITYGGSTDTWGEALSPSDINSVNFGVAVSAHNQHPLFTATLNVDHYELVIYYTDNDPTDDNNVTLSMTTGTLIMNEGVLIYK